jgi:hypothetical protein
MDILKMLGELRQEREQVNVRDRSPRDSGVAKVSRKIGAKNGSRWSVYWSSRAGRNSVARVDQSTRTQCPPRARFPDCVRSIRVRALDTIDHEHLDGCLC